MTEAEWRTTTDVEAMLRALAERPGWAGPLADRFRLFVRACIRRVWPLLPPELAGFASQFDPTAPPDTETQAVFRTAYTTFRGRVDAARAGFEGGTVTGSELARLQSGAYAALAMSAAIRTDLNSAAGAVVLAAQAVGWFELVDDWTARSAAFSDLRTAMMGIISPSVEELAAQADLLRCIFGNPFAPAAFDPSWRTEVVIALARGIDADAAFDRLPVLADALEDAGCADAALLAHGRGGLHVPGCWVVDRALGRW